MYSNMKIRHMGADTMEIKRILEETSEHYVNVGQNIRNMQDVIRPDR
jgi:c-di-AMP phosphodiesterase-like protein